jgi:uncharacterized damage-inducible protein DinB
MQKVAQENLAQINDLLKIISLEDYTKKPEVLSGASIGQHVRHILEFYLLLISGSFTGTISYDKRERNLRIENEPEYAVNTLDRILAGLQMLTEDKPIEFDADYTVDGSMESIIVSSVYRELAYCIEHSIHHQALIKSGLVALGIPKLVGDNFGVAYSTIRYRSSICAQ